MKQSNVFTVLWKVALAVALLCAYRAFPLSMHRPDCVIWGVGLLIFLYVAYVMAHYSSKVTRGVMTATEAWDHIFSWVHEDASGQRRSAEQAVTINNANISTEGATASVSLQQAGVVSEQKIGASRDQYFVLRKASERIVIGIDEFGLTADQRAIALAHLTTIQAQASSPAPASGVLHESMALLMPILQAAAGGVVSDGLTSALAALSGFILR